MIHICFASCHNYLFIKSTFHQYYQILVIYKKETISIIYYVYIYMCQLYFFFLCMNVCTCDIYTYIYYICKSIYVYYIYVMNCITYLNLIFNFLNDS